MTFLEKSISTRLKIIGVNSQMRGKNTLIWFAWNFSRNGYVRGISFYIFSCFLK